MICKDCGKEVTRIIKGRCPLCHTRNINSKKVSHRGYIESWSGFRNGVGGFKEGHNKF